MKWPLILVFLMLLLCSCTTKYVMVETENACDSFTNANEIKKCEKGKEELARQIQKARENAAYQYGRGKEKASDVRLRVWQKRYYRYYWNNYSSSRKPSIESNDAACRYAGMCD